MTSSTAGSGETRYVESRTGSILLGLAYVAVGVALFYGIATDSIELATAALVGVLGLLIVSLLVVVRREGLRTRENGVIGVFVLIALGLLFGLSAFTDLSSSVVFGIVFVVGLVVPHLLVEHAGAGTGG